jgi:tetratricopeptide (TPR) repeat protein
MSLVYTPYYPPELGRRESRMRAPDRAHNEVFDALLTTGVVGLIVALTVFVSLLAAGFRRLGIMSTARQRRAFLWIILLGAAAGVSGPYLVDGSLRFIAIGVPAGIVAGSLAFVLASGLRRGARRLDPVGRDELLLIGLLAAVMAHFVEIHFGIAVTATRLCFWVYAGVVVASGTSAVRAEVGLRRNRRRELAIGGHLVGLSPITGLLLVILTFDFYRYGTDLYAQGIPLGILFASVWLLGAALVAAEEGAGAEKALRLGAYAAISLGIWLLFAAVHVAWADHAFEVNRFDTKVVRALAAHQLRAVDFLYAAVLALTAVSAAVSALRESPPAARAVGSRWRAAAYPCLLAAAALAIVRTNLDRAEADVLAKQGEVYESRREWEAARTVYEEALRIAPREDRYLMNLGRVLLERTKAEDIDAAERDRRFAATRSVLRRAQEISPLNADHPRNLARAERAWALASEAVQARQAHYRQADSDFQRALQLSPNNAAMWNEWATLRLERGDRAGALALLDRSLRVDPLYKTTHWLRANANLNAGELVEALADYERALAIDAELLPALSGKALALTRLGRLEEAIQVTERAIAVAPDDMVSHRNLAVLYRQSGRLDRALEQARLALERAADREKPAIERFIAELTLKEDQNHR